MALNVLIQFEISLYIKALANAFLYFDNDQQSQQRGRITGAAACYT